MTRAKIVSKIITNADLDGDLDVAGETTLQTHLNMGDGDIIKLGASSDLTIQHDGSNSYIKEDGTGSLLIWSTGTEIKFLGGSGAETMVDMNVDGSVDLYHNNAKKLETSSTGVTSAGTYIGTAAGSASAPNFAVTSGSVGVNGMYVDSANELKFASGGAERLTLSSAGITSTGLSLDGGTIKLDGNYPTASGNSALGDDALGSASLSGGYNTAIGDHAMQANTSGNNNTAIGHQALYNNTTGTLNSGLGLNSMFNNTSGTQSQAIGYRSMFAHTTGTGNTAVGLEAANSITTGSFNTMLGRYTADSLTTGNYNTHMGNDTDVSGAAVEFTVAIGHGAVDKGTNTGMINPTSGVYQGNNSASWSTVSDRRIKKNIEDNNDGLNAINQVQVKNFEYRTEDEIIDFDNPKSAVVNKQGVQLGVIAQEIQSILPDMVKEESTGVLSVNPDNMTWHLVNAVKELSAQVNVLTARISELEEK